MQTGEIENEKANRSGRICLHCQRSAGTVIRTDVNVLRRLFRKRREMRASGLHREMRAARGLFAMMEESKMSRLGISGNLLLAVLLCVAVFMLFMAIRPAPAHAQCLSFPKIISAHSDGAVRKELAWR
jgi:hypothetical protein